MPTSPTSPPLAAPASQGQPPLPPVPPSENLTMLLPLAAVVLAIVAFRMLSKKRTHTDDDLPAYLAELRARYPLDRHPSTMQASIRLAGTDSPPPTAPSPPTPIRPRAAGEPAPPPVAPRADPAPSPLRLRGPSDEGSPRTSEDALLKKISELERELSAACDRLSRVERTLEARAANAHDSDPPRASA
ncbi:MAG: hypothetical protein SFZ23_07080 [Planctomycetota bacterium]|nr:hypothetical protein [Planctomycetota bacterium]